MRKWRKSLCGLLVGLAAATTGCWQEPKPTGSSPPSYQGITLTVGSLEDAGPLGGVVSQRGEWVHSRGGEITIRERPETIESAGEVDVLIFPGNRLGELLDAGRLEAIPNEAVMPAKRPDEVRAETGRSSSEETPAPEDPFDYMDIATRIATR